MGQLQDIFDKMQDAKKEQRHLRAVYKDMLTNYKGYKELTDKIKTLKDEKRQIEEVCKEQCSKELDQVEKLKFEIEADREAINDIVVNKLMKGENISLVDKFENEYEPIFNVKFRRI